jgi:RND family efflux transporter MFP subunit
LIEENGILRSGSEISIFSETSGIIIFAHGNPGEPVVSGQTLVKVEHDVVKSQFELSKTALENAERDFARYSNMAGGEAVTQQQLEASKLNYQNALVNYTGLKKQLDNTEIKSPVNGIIAKRFVESGDNLFPSVQVFSILEKDRMVFVLKLAENDLPQIKKSQKAIISLDILRGKTLTGKVQSIGVMPDMSGRYEVEITLGESNMQLRAGLSGKALFENTVMEKGIVIPRKCITGSVNNANVFLVAGDSVVSRPVKAVSINETDVLITEGLSSGDKVVLSGQINLVNGARVNVIN